MVNFWWILVIPGGRWGSDEQGICLLPHLAQSCLHCSPASDDIVTSLPGQLPTFRLSPSVQTFHSPVQLCRASSLVSNKTSPWIPEVNSGEATLRSSGRRSGLSWRPTGEKEGPPLLLSSPLPEPHVPHLNIQWRIQVDTVKGGGGWWPSWWTTSWQGWPSVRASTAHWGESRSTDWPSCWPSCSTPRGNTSTTSKRWAAWSSGRWSRCLWTGAVCINPPQSLPFSDLTLGGQRSILLVHKEAIDANARTFSKQPAAMSEGKIFGV